MGCDRVALNPLTSLTDFNPRTPCGVRPMASRISGDQATFQSTHPVWGATQSAPWYGVLCVISIHAPRVGCDGIPPDVHEHLIGISIHAPRVGCDEISTSVTHASALFQSTHPVWGATALHQFHPCLGQISIHAPRVGCDSPVFPTQAGNPQFQSTHPVWGATQMSN